MTHVLRPCPTREPRRARNSCRIPGQSPRRRLRPSSAEVRGGLTDLGHVIGRGQIDLADPATVEQMRMAPPAILWRLARIVVRVVVDRHVDGRAIRDVAVVFFLQRAAVILEMIEDIERAVPGVFDKAGSF